MVSIPLPFVVSLLLLVLAGSVLSRKTDAPPLAAYFLVMCAVTTAVVGLRWLLDWSILRMLQPIFASLIPVLAWYVFSRAHTSKRLAWWHSIMPTLVIICSLTYPWWEPPLDLILTGLYVGYGVAFWYMALSSSAWSENIAVSELPKASLVMRIAGSMLLFSAIIDGALSLDFMFADGAHAMLILAIGHGFLLPILALAVIWINAHTKVAEPINEEEAPVSLLDKASDGQNEEEAKAIMDQVTHILKGQQLYLDPDLTLAKLARKSGVPSRLISNSVNQVYQLNISQWVNRYRIEHAQTLLKQTDLPVTQVYLESGFQTKSNFHREFSRQVGSTPSAYRKACQS